ncbi:MAG TPA: DIP1984 family protein [Dehalococcoidia bacterium]|jgi:hypothetical protein|nr:DIP1984 family protein [Dehalococcoidia bacterium]
MPARKNATKKRARASASVKLADALSRRADLQKRIEQIRQRMQRNALVQQGEAPAEDPRVLLRDFDAMADELQRLIERINRTNALTEIDDGPTISDAIAERDTLRIRHTAYRELAQAATVVQSRTTKSEVKFQATVNVTQLQKRADEFARKHREIDQRIQQANWSTDLVD